MTEFDSSQKATSGQRCRLRARRDFHLGLCPSRLFQTQRTYLQKTVSQQITTDQLQIIIDQLQITLIIHAPATSFFCSCDILLARHLLSAEDEKYVRGYQKS